MKKIRRFSFVPWAAALTLCLFAAPSLRAQSPAPAAQLDFLAMDSKGLPVDNLSASELRLTIGKQPVVVRSVEPVPAADAAQPERFVLLFDEMLIPERHQFEDAAAALVAAASPARQFAVLRYDDYDSLQHLQDFTSDVSLLQKAVRIPITTSDRAAVYLQEARAANNGGFLPSSLWRSDASDFFGALEKLAAELGKTPGRKVLILMSPGIIFSTSQQADLKRAASVLSRAGVVVYVVRSLDVIHRVYDYFGYFDPLAAITGGRLIESAPEPGKTLRAIVDEQSRRLRLRFDPAPQPGPFALSTTRRRVAIAAPAYLPADK